MKNWIKEHYKIILLVLGLTIIGPLIINILFKLHPTIDFFVAEWDASATLSYYGTILADRYRSIIGQVVKGKIDRPMGSFHPRHKDLYYPVNYGYVSGLLGGDGAEQDIYLLGVKSAEQEFTGKVIAVYHRYDDNETKWIVVPCDDEGIVLEDVEIPTDNEIYAQIAFQEQFFSGVLVK